MSLSFITAFATTKVNDAARGAIDALVSFDPAGATEAQLSLMEQTLDQLGTKIATTQRQYDDAKAKLDVATKLNGTRLTAAEALQADPTKAGSLDRLLAIIEQAQPELDGLKRDEADVKLYLADLRAAYDGAATKLKTARRDLVNAQRDMERADIEQRRAKDRADAAALAAGVHSGGDALNTALDAMKRKATAAHDAAEAANLKASSLAPVDHEKDDPALKAALDAAAGVSAAPSSVADRLAALKSRAA